MSDTIIIVDENDQEIEMEVLFTFESEDSGKTYVFYFDPNDSQGRVLVSRYCEDGALYPVLEDDDDMEVIEEVFNSFMEAQMDEESHHCGCNCNCHSH